MKFTDGFWVVKPEFKAFYATQVRDARIEDNELLLYCPFKRIDDRGDTLNIGQLTLTCFTPMDDVIGVKITDYIGGVSTSPTFELLSRDNKGTIELGGTHAKIIAKALTLEANQEHFEINFKIEEKPLTKIDFKSLGRMIHKDGTKYLYAGLSLGVGELVYGMGERFGAIVKNGQSIDSWNEDGGTSSDISYKNIPFYMTNKGYGVFVDHPGKVSFEVASEKVEQVQFSVADEELTFYIIYGPTPKEIIEKYTRLTGRPALPPPWSFGLWLTTSFTTNYDEDTVTHFIEGMAEHDIPLHVFHFDCFWMKELEWCNFEWDKDMFKEPEAMLKRLHNKGLKICLWINPYIAQKSSLFKEAIQNGYLVKNNEGKVFQWDMWQAGMGIVDFTNPEACAWFSKKLEGLLDMGVDCFKTDFGERIPTEVVYFNGADPIKMHNYYTYLYNECVFKLLQRKRGKDEAVLFARSATVGGQKFPVHWGGDSTSQYVSMAESLRGGLSLCSSGFGFWSHDIGGFESDSSPDLYKRWVAFGMLSSHSRLHGSTSYRVPWFYDKEACQVLSYFTKLKCTLMPYLFYAAVTTHQTGIPVMRSMALEFPNERNCEYLDRQYMLGDSFLVAPIFLEDGTGECYLPEGMWTHFLTGEKVLGGKWHKVKYDYFSLPLFVRENSIIPIGNCNDKPDYEYAEDVVYHVFEIKSKAEGTIYRADSSIAAKLTATCDGNTLHFEYEGNYSSKILLRGIYSALVSNDIQSEVTKQGILLKVTCNSFSLQL